MAWIRSTPVVEGILAGSLELEQEFVERYLARLQVFFRARLSDSALPDDLTQETLVAALVSLRAGKLRDPAALDAFVLGVARNQLAEALRVQGRSVPLEQHDAAPAAGLDPEVKLAVQQELAGLAGQDQRILWLILIEGYRPAEVAPREGLTEEAVRQRKSRSLRRLHEKLFGPAVTNPALDRTLSRSDPSGKKP